MAQSYADFVNNVSDLHSKISSIDFKSSAQSLEAETRSPSIAALKVSRARTESENAKVWSENLQFRVWLETNATRLKLMEAENVRLSEQLRSQSNSTHTSTAANASVTDEETKPYFKFEMLAYLIPSVMVVGLGMCM